MSVIKFKAKVRLFSEEELEIESQYDTGNITKDPQWGWRSMGIPVDEIYKIIAFSSTRSLVILQDEDKLIVNEPFSTLFERWRELMSQKTPEEEVNKIAEDEMSDETNDEGDD